MADQVFWQSTDRLTVPEVGWPGGRPMCTNVYNQFGLSAGRPGGRPLRPLSTDRSTVQRALLSGSGLGWSGSRPVGQNPGTIDRQAATIINLTVGRSTGRSTNSRISCWIGPQGLDFIGLYYGAVLGCIRQDFKWVFKLVFPISCRGFLHLF